MGVYLDRAVLKNQQTFPDQPNLWEMTDRALQIVTKNPNGFFLMVEGASIDKMLHPMDSTRAIYDTIEMDKAVGLAKRLERRQRQQHPDSGPGRPQPRRQHHRHLAGSVPGRAPAKGYAPTSKPSFPTYFDADKDGFPDDPTPVDAWSSLRQPPGTTTRTTPRSIGQPCRPTRPATTTWPILSGTRPARAT